MRTVGEDSDSDFEDPPPRKGKRKTSKKKTFWRVSRSTVPFDPRFKDLKKSLGVYATKTGRFKIYFVDSVHVCKTHMREREWTYGIQ